MININKKTTIIMIFLIMSLLLAFFVSSASSSSIQFRSPGSSFDFLSGQGIDISPKFNQDMCQSGQDFIVQVNPFGCTPKVIRSDLLEEQNVPVFCQLSATQLNPLIDVKAIDSISFKGEYPKEISGIGFHPARAAIRNSRTTLLNSPILENIGYAVIVLKQNPNESSMPDFIEGNLTAFLRYDIENAFGIGKASYYLPELTDQEWKNKFTQYGFWNGKAYLKTEGVDENGAIISIYLDENNRFSTFNLKKGQTSENIFLPGLYCAAGLKIRLDSFENPDTRAKLNINGDIVEVADNEKFLQNECTMRDIEKQGINQKVEISCRTDDGFERFDLTIAPKVTLKILNVNNGEPKDYAMGDKLYEIQDLFRGSKSVYLGYIGESPDGTKFVIPVVSPEFTSEAFRGTLIYGQLPNLIKSVQYESKSILVNLVLGIVKSGGLITALTSNFLTTGSYPVGWIYEKDSNKNSEGVEFLESFEIPFINTILGNKIEFIGLADATNNDKILDDNEELKQSYENAMEDYRRIIDSFPSEKIGDENTESSGEQALLKAIYLSRDTGQKKTTSELCKEFEERYPNSEINLPDDCKNSLKISNTEISTNSIVINGKTKTISFEGIYEPTIDEYGANILIRNSKGEITPVSLRKDQIVYFGERNEEVYTAIGTTPPIKYYFRFYNGNWQFTRFLSNPWTSVTNENQNKITASITAGNVKELARNLINKDSEEGETLLNKEGATKKTETSSQFMQLISLEEDSARIKSSIFSGERRLILNRAENFQTDYTFSLTKVNLKKVAKVSVLPNIQNTGTEANFSFRIEIEKRAIQLSPEKIRDKIDILNESIEKWEGTSETLGNVVRGFNAACLTTGAVLTVKNFFNNLDGKSIARQEVMKNPGGWNDICKDEIAKPDSQYTSLDDCFFENSNKINNDVEVVYQAMQNQQPITDVNLCNKLGEIIGELGENVVDPRDNSRLFSSENIKAISNPNDKGECEKSSLTQAKDLERLNIIINNPETSINLKKLSEIKRYKILSDINENLRGYAAYQSYTKNLEDNNALEGVGIRLYAGKDSIQGVYDGGTSVNQYEGIAKDSNVQAIIYKNKEYLLVLSEGNRNEFGIVSVHHPNGILINDENPLSKEIKGRFSSFKRYDRSSYENNFLNPEVKYYETEPFKGLPALVPFDTNDGWYAATKQTVWGLRKGISAFDDSGAVSSFWVCNVGENGRAEFNQGSSGLGDDICQQFNPGLGQVYGTFPGLEERKTNQLVSKAKQAIEQASRAYEPGLRGFIQIGSERIKVGSPAVDIPEFQCQNFMSPEDCLILFNVCDPVVCPSSRCDLGGTYPVADVVGSGIIGSTLLCLPNARENIAVPICLSGVKAGLDSWVSVQKNYRDCLKENLETGATIGICDEIHSIYLCDFFWEQAAPLSQIAIPTLFEFLSGKSAPRGGGEYLGVASAWQNAQNSVDYITQYYGANSFAAFNARAVEGVGKAICKNFISGTYPTDIGFDDLIAPRSPPQFTAWFSENTFTTATVPPTSQYKVFYHIYAGENNIENIGAYYSVYLRNPSGTSFYQTPSTLPVSSGYISKGDYASETKDFTAPTGYKELCIRVNAQESCGYQKVSTEFALNYVNDLYLNEQASETNINSELDCVAGTPSLYSLINPNIQSGVSEAINPELYNQGIVRICSTDNPGKGTDPSRWKQVGTCDEGRGDIKCYIDTDSVEKIIKSISLKNETLDKISKDALDRLRRAEEVLSDKEFDKILLLNPENQEDRIKIINRVTDGLIQKAFYNIQKVRLLFLRGDAYSEITKIIFDRYISDEEKLRLEKLSESVKDTDDAGLTTEEDKWTLRTALEELKTREGKYSENKIFINSLYIDGILKEKEWNWISGRTLNNWQEDMEYVRILLENKLIERGKLTFDDAILTTERDKWTIRAALEELKTREGKYSENNIFINNLYIDEVLTEDEWNEIKGGTFTNWQEDMEFVRVLLEQKLFEGVKDSDDAGLDTGFVEIPNPKNIDRLDSEEISNRFKVFGNIIPAIASEYEVSELLIRAIIIQESEAEIGAPGDGGNSYGLMQITQIAVDHVADSYDDNKHTSLKLQFSAVDGALPSVNIKLGTAYYKLLEDIYKSQSNSDDDLKKISLAAYNWGLGNVENNCTKNGKTKWENCRNVPSSVLQYISNIIYYERNIYLPREQF